MKTLVLGDVHGRTIWKDIIEKEDPDRVIFLGDYVSTHEGIDSDQQIEELYAILDYKENNPDKVILLRGNHDMEALGFYWAECNPRVEEPVARYMRTKDVTNWFLSNTQWAYQIPFTKIVCSHAGISKQFYETVEKKWSVQTSVVESCNSVRFIDKLNSLEPSELFGFTPCKLSDYAGISATQPCTWIRPSALLEYGVKDMIHVVGHTPIKHICNLKDSFLEMSQMEEMDLINSYCDVWCCDCLANKEYLIIEDGEFKPRKLE